MFYDFCMKRDAKKKEETLKCPFCGEEAIKVIKEETFKASRSNFGRDVKMRMLTDECSNCGESASKVKKKLKKKGYPL